MEGAAHGESDPTPEAEAPITTWFPATVAILTTSVVRPLFAIVLLGVAMCMGKGLYDIAVAKDDKNASSLFAIENFDAARACTNTKPNPPSHMDARDDNFVSLAAIDTAKRVARSLLAFSIFLVFMRTGSRFLLPDEKSRNKKAEKKQPPADILAQLRKSVDSGVKPDR